MDNRTIDLVSEGKSHLSLALQIMVPSSPAGKVTHYKVVHKRRVDRALTDDKTAPPTLILLWHDGPDATPLAYAMNTDQAIEFAWGWLGANAAGQRPDIDGDCDAGFRAFTESWGHVFGHSNAVVGIQPAWAIYGN